MDVSLDLEKHKFFCIVEGLECYAKFEIIDQKTWEFIETFVPEKLRGRGIANEMYDEIVKYLDEHDMMVIPSCSFAKTYFDEYAQYLIV